MKKSCIWFSSLLILFSLITLCGCSSPSDTLRDTPVEKPSPQSPQPPASTSIPTPAAVKTAAPSVNEKGVEAKDKKSEKQQPPEGSDFGSLRDKVVCIDAGHQAKGNSEKEPVAPGSDILKAKVSSGTSGVATKIPEYKFTLSVALKLKKALEAQGAKVVMVRETNDVNISNAERAKAANDCKADIAVRIHADGSENSSVKGISLLYPGSMYIRDTSLLSKSKSAASKVLKNVVSSTGANSRGTIERNDLTGFNWSTVPVILIESGFMSNPDEDRLLNTPDYQDKLVRGMVRGLADYFESIG